MKHIQDRQRGISTILAFALIPLSGFATDIYIPSLPAMASDLHVSIAAVQLSLVLFFISSGISQLFTGAILDSFGRYRAGLFALALFAAASFVIALYPGIYILYAMRIVQGITISLIVVGKRAFFADMYTGETLKHYTSLFVIIWSAAPILAPFIGGYLQYIFGWQSSFYFLGGLAVLFLVLELLFSGESLKQLHPFKARPVLAVYAKMIRSADFALGLAIIGTCYGLVVMYGLASPFIIESVFHCSAVTTGYSSLLSGAAIFIGGTIAKMLIKIPLVTKAPAAIIFMAVFSGLILMSGIIYTNLLILIGLTVCLHISGGFLFNVLYGYSLGRFSGNAGTAAGLTGGVLYIVSSIVSYGFVSLYGITNQALLGVANTTGVLLIVMLFFAFKKYSNNR